MVEHTITGGGCPPSVVRLKGGHPSTGSVQERRDSYRVSLSLK